MAATTYKKYYKITEDSFFLCLDKFSHSHKTIIPTRAFLHVVSRDVLFHFFPSPPPLPPFFFKMISDLSSYLWWACCSSTFSQSFLAKYNTDNNALDGISSVSLYLFIYLFFSFYFPFFFYI